MNYIDMQEAVEKMSKSLVQQRMREDGKDEAAASADVADSLLYGVVKMLVTLPGGDHPKSKAHWCTQYVAGARDALGAHPLFDRSLDVDEEDSTDPRFRDDFNTILWSVCRMFKHRLQVKSFHPGENIRNNATIQLILPPSVAQDREEAKDALRKVTEKVEMFNGLEHFKHLKIQMLKDADDDLAIIFRIKGD